MSTEVVAEDGGIISSLYIEVRGWDGHGTITVRSRGKTVGTLTAPTADVPLLMARLLGPQGHDAMCGTKTVLERCVSLVQSLAQGRSKDGYDGPQERVDVYENEAYAIAKDAGWET